MQLNPQILSNAKSTMSDVDRPIIDNKLAATNGQVVFSFSALLSEGGINPAVDADKDVLIAITPVLDESAEDMLITTTPVLDESVEDMLLATTSVLQETADEVLISATSVLQESAEKSFNNDYDNDALANHVTVNAPFSISPLPTRAIDTVGAAESSHQSTRTHALLNGSLVTDAITAGRTTAVNQTVTIDDLQRVILDPKSFASQNQKPSSETPDVFIRHAITLDSINKLKTTLEGRLPIAPGSGAASLDSKAQVLVSNISPQPEFIGKLNLSSEKNVSHDISAKIQAILADKLAFQVNTKTPVATVRLDPPELGKLDLFVKVDGDKLSVSITATNATTREAILQTTDRLRQDLLGNGYINVDVDVQQNLDDAKRDSLYDNNEVNIIENITDKPTDEIKDTVKQQYIVRV